MVPSVFVAIFFLTPKYCLLRLHFRALWSNKVKGSQLIDLSLPTGFHLTGALLKEMAAKYPFIEHLSLSSPCERITSDEGDNPFDGFANLKSLAVELGYGFNCPRSHRATDRKSIGAVFDNLQITSLKLSGLSVRGVRRQGEGIWSQSERLIPGPVTTPNLIKILTHLQIKCALDVQDAEYLLFHCRHLKTVWLEHVYMSFNGDEYPPLIKSRQHMSPFLRSATFGVSSGRNEVWVSLEYWLGSFGVYFLLTPSWAEGRKERR